MANGDFSGFPIEPVFLAQTPTWTFLRQVLSSLGKDAKNRNEWGNQYASMNEYLADHPESLKVDRSSGPFAYYELVRTPTISEVRRVFANSPSITKVLADQGVSPDEIVRAVAHEDACGGVPCQEEFLVRPMYVAFLSVANISTTSQILTQLDSMVTSDGFEFGSFDDSTREPFALALPNAPIRPDETILIPVAIVLAPFGHVHRDIFAHDEEPIDECSRRTVDYLTYPAASRSDFRIWGSAQFPVRIRGNALNQEVHALDLSNLYEIDTYWMMGSCPHLFWVKDALEYASVVLPNSDGVVETSKLRVPRDVSALRLVELEDEITTIDSVQVAGRNVAAEIQLAKGESITVEVRPGDVVEIVGSYRSLFRRSNPMSATAPKNDLVCEFLREHAECGEKM
ncbi:MAG: hypothetical protein AAB250_16715 [Bdellovibrionota bacterium]